MAVSQHQCLLGAAWLLFLHGIDRGIHGINAGLLDPAEELLEAGGDVLVALRLGRALLLESPGHVRHSVKECVLYVKRGALLFA